MKVPLCAPTFDASNHPSGPIQMHDVLNRLGLGLERENIRQLPDAPLEEGVRSHHHSQRSWHNGRIEFDAGLL